MANRFLDGADHYATADILTKWSSAANISDFAVSSTAARVSTANGQGLRYTGASRVANISKALSSTITDSYVGFHLRTSSLAAEEEVCWFKSGASNMSILRLETSGALRMVNTNGGTVFFTTTSSLLVANTWYFIEIRFKPAASGVAEVRVNGSVPTNGTFSGDTRGGAGSTTTVDTFVLGAFNSNTTTGRTYDYDNIYWNDTAGGVNDGYWGEFRVETLWPTGAGNYSALTRGGADSGTNYGQVDETTNNSDTDYVYSGSAGDTDTYTYSDLAVASGSVLAVQTALMARKDDLASRTIAPRIRKSSTDYDGTTSPSITSSYACYLNQYDTHPDTTAWSVSQANALEMGPKVVS